MKAVCILLLILILVGCASKMRMLAPPQPIIASGQKHIVAAVVTGDVLSGCFTTVYLFGPDGKLENTSCSSSPSLFSGTVPTALATGFTSSINAAITSGFFK